MPKPVVRGLASRLRLKLGFSTTFVGTADVVRGLASRLRLKHETCSQQLYIPNLRRQGDGVVSTVSVEENERERR